MHLVEILLPVVTPEKLRLELDSLSRELTDKFGGLTTFARAPGEGLWDDAGATQRDTVVVVEVMTDSLDRAWWRNLRLSLEDRLGQKEIVIRTYAIDKL